MIRLAHVLTLAVVLSILASTFALTFQVEPKTTSCLYEDVVSGSVTVSWEVVRGGLLDVNIKISGPLGEVYHQELYFEGRGAPGYKTFVAQNPGRYSFCYDNEMSRWTAKVVSITISKADDHGQEAAPNELAKSEHVTYLQKSISKISNGLAKVESEQSYFRKREHRHRNTAERTCERVLWWSVGESVVLLSVSVGQVFILRRWFGSRRAGVV